MTFSRPKCPHSGISKGHWEGPGVLHSVGTKMDQGTRECPHSACRAGGAIPTSSPQPFHLLVHIHGNKRFHMSSLRPNRSVDIIRYTCIPSPPTPWDPQNASRPAPALRSLRSRHSRRARASESRHRRDPNSSGGDGRAEQGRATGNGAGSSWKRKE